MGLPGFLPSRPLPPLVLIFSAALAPLALAEGVRVDDVGLEGGLYADINGKRVLSSAGAGWRRPLLSMVQVADELWWCTGRGLAPGAWQQN
jgi:hypothetical protein